jgi:photosystem II stability/assembly factor-like uncharacterized protein
MFAARKNSALAGNGTLYFVMRLFVLALLPLLPASAQISPDHYSAMRWRQIGPFRAGRVSAVAGIPGNAAVYYMGTPGGGIWKTVNAGTTWLPISDGQIPVSSIGSIVVAPSDPNILYAGTGDVSNVGGAVNEGDGVYKSLDAGKTWQHIGLDQTEHVVSLWIHPTNPDIVIAAALGKTFAPNPERGIFKTTDGGKSWRKVFYKDDTTGAVDLSFAPDNPNIGYAAVWYHYVKPGNARAQIEGTGGGGIYKTTDGGETWSALTAGLPTNQVGRIGVAAAPGGKRAFAIVAAGRGSGGLFRTDDGGATWTKSSTDSRIQGSGYFSRVFLDPKNPDVVYVAQTSLYRSDDGGHNFIAYKGAPGGDDNHALWIDPTNSDRMILASDQGGTISMDRGLSWSSWYNQPTGQIYHLSVDNRYPYWVYGTQQDSGAIGTLSRGDYGNITFMDWDPVAGYEFGYIIPDPLNNNILFSGAPARGLVKIDRVNRQTANISPNVSRDGDYRTAVNPPLAFSPQDPHLLYWGTQFLMETRDAGVTWKHASPDLTKRPETAVKDAAPATDENPTTALGVKPKAREADDTVRPPDRSAINTFALSPLKQGQIWVGTTNGLIHLSQDAGATWTQITPPGLTQFSLISMVEASHFDPATAYVAVDRHEENDSRPHIFITRDSGKTWSETVAGIPARSFVRVVREDPKRKGLLYAGTETAAYVSFDDGAHWSSLQNKMPVTSVRDMVVHGDDLVVCTYGRAFWILDDLTPLRQLNHPLTTTFLFEPEKALRVRRDQNGDTPIPPELPAGTNPPDGAIIDYYLNAAPNSDIQMSIYDANGNLVRDLSSKPEPKSTEPPPNVPEYWLARPASLPVKAGLNRFVWDLRYASPPVVRHEYPISALYENTPAEPVGAIAMPGKYEIRLTVDGKTYKQPLELTMDPRVDVSPAAISQEFSLEQTVQALIKQSYEGYHQAQMLKDNEKVSKLMGNQAAGGGPPAAGKPKPTFVLLNRELGSLATAIDSADTAPTEAMRTAYTDYCKDLSGLVNEWNDLIKTDKLSAQPLPSPSCK